MEQVLSWLSQEFPWLVDHSILLGSVAVVLGLVSLFLTPFGRLFFRPKPADSIVIAPESIDALKQDIPAKGAKLTVAEFIQLRRDMREDLLKELEQADDPEKSTLRGRITELEGQIANPDPAFADLQARIAELESLLAREGNEIGAERLTAATALLEKGDFSLADDIFAEIEARETLAVQRAARAAFGRGEVAEAEIRWKDAADHYVRAAQLDPTWDSLSKAGEFLWRDGRNQDALPIKQHLLELSRREYGTDDQKTARALNELAVTQYRLGKYEEAEALYLEALEIDRATIGEGHPNYAIRLNNLAGVIEGQGRYEEAETLYREALEIDRATIGEGHPDYAIDLNNLAGVIQAQGRYEEAETLYREALGILETRLAAEHPTTLLVQKNLQGLLDQRAENPESTDGD